MAGFSLEAKARLFGGELFCLGNPLGRWYVGLMARDDLFASAAKREPERPTMEPEPSARHQPLAARLRPRDLNEFAGQAHILGPGQLLRRAIEADRIQSLIFYGPPGTGKTSLAQIIACQTKSKFERLSGAESNVADMRRVLSAAANRLENTEQSTILSSTRSIVSTKRSRTCFCPMWKAA